jgi:hypothetical protein
MVLSPSKRENYCQRNSSPAANQFHRLACKDGFPHQKLTFPKGKYFSLRLSYLPLEFRGHLPPEDKKIGLSRVFTEQPDRRKETAEVRGRISKGGKPDPVRGGTRQVRR